MKSILFKNIFATSIALIALCSVSYGQVYRGSTDTVGHSNVVRDPGTGLIVSPQGNNNNDPYKSKSTEPVNNNTVGSQRQINNAGAPGQYFYGEPGSTGVSGNTGPTGVQPAKTSPQSGPTGKKQ